MIRIFVALVLICFCLVNAGCETTKGTAEGLGMTAAGVYSTAEGAGTGLVKDSINIAKFLQSVDGWMRENLW
ncbi:MAG: hypothetical protein AB1481_06940 [Candidatus Omnitrophota bacterium]